MAKCAHCGKRGLLLAVNADGYCAECAAGGGLVRRWHIENFWAACTAEEKMKLRALSPYGTGLDAGNTRAYLSAIDFYRCELAQLTAQKDYELGLKLIPYAEKTYKNTRLLIDKHYYLLVAGEFYYKQRDIREGALDTAIEYFKRDVALCPRVIQLMYDEYGCDSRIPSFQQLAVIYEKQGRYKEGIAVCEKALKYGLDDGTKGGFAGRIERMKGKLEKGVKRDA